MIQLKAGCVEALADSYTVLLIDGGSRRHGGEKTRSTCGVGADNAHCTSLPFRATQLIWSCFVHQLQGALLRKKGDMAPCVEVL